MTENPEPPPLPPGYIVNVDEKMKQGEELCWWPGASRWEEVSNGTCFGKTPGEWRASNGRHHSNVVFAHKGHAPINFGRFLEPEELDAVFSKVQNE